MTYSFSLFWGISHWLFAGYEFIMKNKFQVARTQALLLCPNFLQNPENRATSLFTTFFLKT
jgi:hypothetical protein